MSCTRADVIAELGRAGRPLPSSFIADRLQKSRATVGAILSKLALYGQIDRVQVPGKGYGREPYQYLYMLKPVQEQHQ